MIRIVKMHFREECINDFIALFAYIRKDISSFPGCESVRLLKDKNTSGVFFTYSIWKDEASLENYRTSAFFAKTWKTTKAMFAQSAEAWSVDEVIVDPLPPKT